MTGFLNVVTEKPLITPAKPCFAIIVGASLLVGGFTSLPLKIIAAVSSTVGLGYGLHKLYPRGPSCMSGMAVFVSVLNGIDACITSTTVAALSRLSMQYVLPKVWPMVGRTVRALRWF